MSKPKGVLRGYSSIKKAVKVRNAREEKERDGKAMTRYCSRCGKELQPGSKFCIACGNPVKSTRSDSLPGSGNRSVRNEYPVIYPAHKKKKDRNKKVAVMSVILVFLLIALATIKIVKNRMYGYEMPIQCFCDYLSTGDTDYLEKMAPLKAYKKLSRKLYKGDLITPDVVASYGSIDEYVETSSENFLLVFYLESMEELRKFITEEFGTDFQLEYEILKKEKLDQEDIPEKWKMELEFYKEHGIKVDFYKVGTELKIKGTGGRETEKIDMKVANFEGEWTLLFDY